MGWGGGGGKIRYLENTNIWKSKRKTDVLRQTGKENTSPQQDASLCTHLIEGESGEGQERG